MWEAALTAAQVGDEESPWGEEMEERVEAEPPPALACAAPHTASASQAAGRWRDVVGVCLWADCKFFLFFSLSLFLLKEMRGSIDWEDRRPLCGRKCVSAARKYLEITKSRLYFLSSLNETLGCHSYERQWKNRAE